MAIDKAVDSARLDGALKASADEIRAKTGDSGKVQFDLDGGTGFKAAIAAIEAGGGGVPSGLSAFELIEWTPSADIGYHQSEVSIPHSLGVIPDGYFIAAITDFEYTDTRYIKLFIFDVVAFLNNYYRGIGTAYKTGATSTFSAQGELRDFVTNSKVLIYRGVGSGTAFFKGGCTYQLFVYKR